MLKDRKVAAFFPSIQDFLRLVKKMEHCIYVYYPVQIGELKRIYVCTRIFVFLFHNVLYSEPLSSTSTSSIISIGTSHGKSIRGA